MPMIWTDADGIVRRTHYQPDMLDPDDRDGIVVDSIPEPNPPEPYYNSRLVYDAGTDSVSYEYTDPFAQFDVSLSTTEKQELYDAIRSGSFERVMQAAGEYL